MLNLDSISTSVAAQYQQANKADATLNALKGVDPSKMSPEQIKNVAKDFESLFLSEMMSHMFEGDSIGESAFGSAETDDIYKGMMVENYSRAVGKSGGIGIAEYVERALNERALLKAQEV